MRVLMVTPSYHPIKGGAESVIRTLTLNLNKIGIETDVMTFNMDCKWNPRWQGKTERMDNINILKVPGLNWFPVAHSDLFTQRVNLIPGRFRNYFKNYDIVVDLFNFIKGISNSQREDRGPLQFYHL